MKKLIMIMAAMFCMTGAMAQESNVTAPIEKKQVKKMPRKHMDPVAKMARELDLTPEQMTKVRELNAKYPELARGKGRMHRPHSKDSLRFNKMPNGNKKPDMAKRKELREKYDKELKDILTKKQFKLYKENREKMREKHDMRMQGKPELKN